MAEEAKNPRRTMPLAILFALLASTVLYLLVVAVSTTLVSPAELAGSEAPLTLVFERSGASHSVSLSLIGLIAAMNGVIVQIVMASRILYGLAKGGWIHSGFGRVHGSYQTPVTATVIVLAAMIAGAVILPLVSLAQLTSLLVLVIFTLVNAALILIKRRHRDHSGYVDIPAPIPYLGVVLCLGTLIFQIVN